MNRRKILTITTALAALAAGGVLARPLAALAVEEVELFDDDRILGAADAPITIIEFSSLTCPHCANFHQNTLPLLKKSWIDTGKAKLVYRHFPLDGLALRAAAIANCVPGTAHFGFLNLLFNNQERWARAKDPVVAIGQLGKMAGLSQDKIDSCVADENEMNLILQRAQDGQEKYTVKSTPTFVVNGVMVPGFQTIEQFDAILNKAASET